MSVLNQLRRRFGIVRKLPGWAVMRLATITGVNAGWWVMAFWASIGGALFGVMGATAVHHYLKRSPTIPVRSEVEND